MAFNSPLQPWIDFHLNFSLEFDISPSPLKPCVAAGKIINCSAICYGDQSIDDFGPRAALFDPSTPTNLVNCGIWWAVSIADKWASKLPENLIASATAILPPIGLDFPLLGFSIDNITSTECLASLHDYQHPNDPAANLCSFDTIFGYKALYEDSTIGNCIDALCTPTGSLDPDIGGIGIFISFVMQSSIAVLAFSTLLYLEHWPRPSRSQGRSERGTHADKMVAAISEFHKAQCYFAGAIQIAAIVLASRATVHVETTNTGFLFTTATNGYIPIIFSLITITLYGRPSWYLILLSSCSFILSTVTLCLSQWFFTSYLVGRNFTSTGLSGPASGDILGATLLLTGICWGFPLADLLDSWCGRSIPHATAIDLSIVTGGWNWVLWTNCLVWFLYCVLCKWLEQPSNLSQAPRMGRLRTFAADFRAMGNRLSSTLAFTLIWRCVFLVTWLICFGYQFYLYSLFFTASLVSTDWTLGQIVAITVWVPSLAEYVYLERHGIAEAFEYKLPHGFHITKRALLSAHDSTNPIINMATSPYTTLPEQSDIELERIWPTNRTNGSPSKIGRRRTSRS